MSFERGLNTKAIVFMSLMFTWLWLNVSAAIKSGTTTTKDNPVRAIKFFQVHNYPHMYRLGIAKRRVKNRLDCSALCLQETPHCLSFAYDSQSLTCTLGTWVYDGYTSNVANNVLIGNSTTAVFTAACCSEKLGYELKFIDKPDLTLCIAKKTNVKKYRAAEVDCGDHAGRLLTAKTKEHFDMFWAMSNGKQIWLGLDDRDAASHGSTQGRQLKWSDGTFLTEHEETDVLGSRAKFNNEKGEHCVHIWDGPMFGLGKRVLNDNKCSKEFQYICEVVVPIKTAKEMHCVCRGDPGDC